MAEENRVIKCGQVFMLVVDCTDHNFEISCVAKIDISKDKLTGQIDQFARSDVANFTYCPDDDCKGSGETFDRDYLTCPFCMRKLETEHVQPHYLDFLADNRAIFERVEVLRFYTDFRV